MVSDPNLNVRTYGQPPYRIAVVHGGPGAAGELATVAATLTERTGRSIIEPLQTARSVDMQVQELATAIDAATPTVILIGHSWGAWLSLLVADARPDLVGGCILVGCGPFEERYAKSIEATRRARMTNPERERFDRLLDRLGDPDAPAPEQENAFAALGELIARIDSYDPIAVGDRSTADRPHVEPSLTIYRSVWPEAAARRRSGELLTAAGRVRCPLAIIHGADDPHPLAGIIEPLAATAVEPAAVIELSRCGHDPWRERDAHESFFKALTQQIEHLENRLANER